MDTGMPFQHNHDASVPECLQVSPVLPVPLHQRSFHPGQSPQHITARINVLCMKFKCEQLVHIWCMYYINAKNSNGAHITFIMIFIMYSANEI